MRVSRWWIAVVVAVVAATGPVASAPAALPGENGKIAFWSSQFNEGSTFDEGIWTIEQDGTGEALLIEGAHSPAWSPDGSKLAYVRGAGDAGEVYTANADGTGEQRLTDDGFVDGSPSWSPDGSSIAWSSNRDGTLEVWIMGGDGSSPRRVTSLRDEAVFSVAARWSPLGDSIAYFVVVRDGPRSVRVVGTDGSGDHAVTPEGFGGSVPDWAPDGSRIVFDSREENYFGALYTVRPDGTGLERIPNLEGEGEGIDGTFISGPVFSADGTKLLYRYITCLIGRCGEGIVLAQADGSAKRTLTGGVRFESFGSPAWQPLNPNRPPDCSAAADPEALWPPNKHLRTVAVAGVTDPDGDSVTLRITGVSHDEGGAADWQPGSAPDQVLLRATRDPKGDGRVYTIAFEARDEHGAGCTGEATVTVPRHKQ